MDILKKVFSSEIKSIDEKEMELTAFISTNAVDRYREVVDPDGMDAKNFKKNPVVLWAHDYSTPPIGKALWVKKEGNGIVSKVKFANTKMGQEIFQLYKDGFMKTFSIGFMPIETENMPMDDPEDMNKPKKPRRIYKKWELLEYSAVPVPANPEALALCVKRGLIKDEDVAGITSKGFDNVDVWNEEPEEIKKKDTETLTGSAGHGLDDLLAEIDVLKEGQTSFSEIIKSKDSQIEELTLVIYNQQKQIEQLNQDPGITADALGEKIVEIAGGVIRKHLGSVKKEAI